MVERSIINVFRSTQVNPSTVNILDSITSHSRYKFVLKWRRKRRDRYETLTTADKLVQKCACSHCSLNTE